MKKPSLISRVVALVLTVMLLTACSSSGGGDSVFERAMSHVSLPRGCSGWKYLVNDYDGDGKVEAYAFGGEENSQYTQWDYIEVYYIDPIGNVTPVITKSTPLVGDPYNTKSLDQNDFRDSYLTIGKQTYALFNVGSVYGSCGYTIALSSYKGKPTYSDVDGSIERVTDQGLVIVPSMGTDDYDVYVSQNGKLVLAKRFDY